MLVCNCTTAKRIKANLWQQWLCYARSTVYLNCDTKAVNTNLRSFGRYMIPNTIKVFDDTDLTLNHRLKVLNCGDLTIAHEKLSNVCWLNGMFIASVGNTHIPFGSFPTLSEYACTSCVIVLLHRGSADFDCWLLFWLIIGYHN